MQRTYNSAKLAAKQEQERQVKLSPDRIRWILQKRGDDGSALATAYSTSKTWNNNTSNKQTSTPYSRISILGLWEIDQHFEYALAQGGFDGESYIAHHGLDCRKSGSRA